MSPQHPVPAHLLLPFLVVTLLVVGCKTESPFEPPEPPEFAAHAVPYHSLPGWADAQAIDAIDALQASCDVWANHDADAPMHDTWPWYGTVGDWQHACTRLADVDTPEDVAQRLRVLFQPMHLTARDSADTALLTGYYEPLLHGARQPTERYDVPLRRLPPDLIEANLGDFRTDAEGTLIGRLDGNRLVPYPDRQSINEGAIDHHNLAFLWVDDRIDKFFLQIQGSGRVELADESLTRVGYAGQNGRAYRAVGRDLIEADEVPAEDMSMQRIRTWMEADDHRADTLMHRNPSYIFFQERTDLDPEEGPIGSQGLPLTAERSLAVDPEYVPLGTPVWLNGTAPPVALEDTQAVSFQQLMVAQDTGGAIKGPLRGDVYWGSSEEAESRAGRMQHPASWYVLVPRAVFMRS